MVDQLDNEIRGQIVDELKERKTQESIAKVLERSRRKPA